MRIVVVSDAWEPQVNGVVRTLRAVAGELAQLGHEVHLITPDQFRSIPCPTYGEIRLALATSAMVGRRLQQLGPNAIHIATEGPLGLAARNWCVANALPFSTAYHTQFPDYLAKRTRLPASCFWPFIRRFHRPSHAILVATGAVERQLNLQGLRQTRRWSRGVDMACFNDRVPPHPRLAALKGPILLYVGRVAVEKNIEAFLASTHAGSRVVVGDGPDMGRLKRKFPEASFLGALHGAELAAAYRAADVLVFPSRTDTFGLVMIEALACGTPVAAFPVQGPIDVVSEKVGCLDDDIDRAIAEALTRNTEACVAFAQDFSWCESARQFAAALVPLDCRFPTRAATPSPERGLLIHDSL